MNEQKKEKDITVLLKLFFFFLPYYYYCYCFLCRYKTTPPPHVFVVRETSNTSEMSGRKRGGGWRCFHALLISRGGLALY